MKKGLFLTAILAVFLWAQVAAAKPSPLYVSAQKSYKSLMASPAKKKYRENWFNVIKKFEKVVKKTPRSPDAPSALFSIGSLYNSLYNHSLLRDDLDKSLEAFSDVVKKYPSSSLADDAQFELGEIYRTKLGDNKSAYLAYSKVVKRFPRGDKAKSARHWVRKLEEFKPQEGKPISVKKETKAFVRKIDYWTNPDSTRVSIETSRDAPYSFHLLSAEPGKKKDLRPRIYVDISNAVLSKDASRTIPIKDGLLTQVRPSQFDDRTVRVVMDIDSIDDYTVFNLTNPFRVIIDVKGEPRIPAEIMREEEPVTVTEDKTQIEKLLEGREPIEMGPDEGTSPESKEITMYQQLGLGVKKIVIDPGHGGEDPGAKSKGGLKEKDIVLKIAKKLGEKIKKELDLDVVMTREGDTFIPLEGRTGIAMKERGDIFVSIHANSSRNKKLRGVSTYVLHPASDFEASAVAARENAVSTKALSELQDLLPKILRPDNYRESRKLARCVQDSLVKSIKSIKGAYPNVRDIGVKEGPFFVLMNSGKPAILVEVSFLSNPEEEKRLSDDGYLDSIAEGILKGIEVYLKEIKVAAT